MVRMIPLNSCTLRFCLMVPLIAGLLLLPVTRDLVAQDVTVRAFLNPVAVGVGRTFVLNVEVAGSQNLDSEPQLPDLSSFATYLGSGSSTSMQIINNRTTVSLTLQYRYQALEEGNFEIPAMDIQVGGERYTTEPLSLTISSAPPPTPQAGGQTSDPTVIGPEDLFITADVSRDRVREGEPVVVEYRIFTRVNVSSYSFTSVPEPGGFWVEELPLPDQPQVEQVVRDGRQYTTAVIRRVALVPTGPGERVIEPLGIEAQVRVRQRLLDPLEGFFDFDRGSLFGTVVPTTVASDPIRLEVEPLPPGRPEPFSGVVGSLDLTATVTPDSVDANEAVTLTIAASGEGNLRGMPDPALELPADFEAYPPEVSEDVQRSGAGLGGSKSWKYVLIPRAPGTRTLPPVSFGYFDTEADGYRTVATEPLTLTVSGDPTVGPTAGVRGAVASLREDIRFIHLGPTRWVRVGESVSGGTGFWLVFLLPMLVLLGAAGFRFQQDRLAGDPAYARRRRAEKIAHSRLAHARRLASGGKARDFFAEVALALRGFVADKVNVAEAGMSTRDAEAALRDRGVSDPAIEEFTACLDHCDRQRYGPEAGDPGEEARFLERVSKVMTELSREMER
jgi:hypothetical protein